MSHSILEWKAQMKVKATFEILYHLWHPLSLPRERDILTLLAEQMENRKDLLIKYEGNLHGNSSILMLGHRSGFICLL